MADDCDVPPPWEVDLTKGEIHLVDLDDDEAWFVIPNYAVRFVNEAAFRLGMRQFVGEDVEAAGAIYSYPKVEKRRVAPLPLEMAYTHDPSGSAYPTAHEGSKRNLRLLNALALRSADSNTSGLQTMRWYPNDGRPAVEFQGHLGAPTLGAVAVGRGMRVGVIITIPDPSTITVLP